MDNGVNDTISYHAMDNGINDTISMIKPQTTRHVDQDSNMTGENPNTDSNVKRCVTKNNVPSESLNEIDIKKEKPDNMEYGEISIKSEPSDTPAIKLEEECLMFWSNKEMNIIDADVKVKVEDHVTEKESSQVANIRFHSASPVQRHDTNTTMVLANADNISLNTDHENQEELITNKTFTVNHYTTG